MLGKRATDSGWQWLAKGDGGPAEKALTAHGTTVGADKFGQQTMQQARGDIQHNNQPSTGASEG